MTKTDLYAGNQTDRKPLRTYDHAAFYPTLRNTDVFICSYPKSGATWLGYLLAQTLKIEANESLDLKTFNRYVPDVNLLYTKRGSLSQFADFLDPRFFLCHASLDVQLPKVVYILRDPRDVMVSYWHYRQFLSRDFKMSLADFLASGDHWPCEWDDHVAGWLLPAARPNVHLVRYEQLHHDTAAVVRGILKFAGIEPDEARIRAAVEASRFERMRSAEVRFGVHGKEGANHEMFVRKGRVASWQEEMGYAELRLIENRYGKTMRAVGYGPMS